MREVAGRAPASRLLFPFSGGTTRSSCFRLGRRRPTSPSRRFPFPVMHLDNGHNLLPRGHRVLGTQPLCAELGDRLIVARVPSKDSIARGPREGLRRSRSSRPPCLQTVTGGGDCSTLSRARFDVAFCAAPAAPEAGPGAKERISPSATTRASGKPQSQRLALEHLQRAHPRASTCASSRLELDRSGLVAYNSAEKEVV